jgi:hypothetical protein
MNSTINQSFISCWSFCVCFTLVVSLSLSFWHVLHASRLVNSYFRPCTRRAIPVSLLLLPLAVMSKSGRSRFRKFTKADQKEWVDFKHCEIKPAPAAPDCLKAHRGYHFKDHTLNEQRMLVTLALTDPRIEARCKGFCFIGVAEGGLCLFVKHPYAESGIRLYFSDGLHPTTADGVPAAVTFEGLIEFIAKAIYSLDEKFAAAQSVAAEATAAYRSAVEAGAAAAIQSMMISSSVAQTIPHS